MCSLTPSLYQITCGVGEPRTSQSIRIVLAAGYICDLGFAIIIGGTSTSTSTICKNVEPIMKMYTRNWKQFNIKYDWEITLLPKSLFLTLEMEDETPLTVWVAVQVYTPSSSSSTLSIVKTLRPFWVVFEVTLAPSEIQIDYIQVSYSFPWTTENRK